MSVRKRTWRNPAGETKEAWVVDYVDQGGARHLKTFARKREADAYHAIVAANVAAGIHTADSKSLTVAKAGQLWLESGEAAKLERATLESYGTLLDKHIVPLIGAVKLAALTVPLVRAFEDRLRADRSPAMVTQGHGGAQLDPRRRAGTRPRRAERRAKPARTAAGATRTGTPASARMASSRRASISPRPTR